MIVKQIKQIEYNYNQMLFSEVYKGVSIVENYGWRSRFGAYFKQKFLTKLKIAEGSWGSSPPWFDC